MKATITFSLALLALASHLPSNEAQATTTLKVHVNQVALERSGPKSAVIEHAGSEASGRFVVLREDEEVLSGKLRQLPDFTEWRGGPKYFEADFSSLAEPGQYRVKVSLGGSSVESAPFTVTDNALFVTAADALLDYFRASRHTAEADKKIRVFDTERYVNVWGGWKDAGGDSGKYLSHLSYANFFSPQQTALAAWALASSYDEAPELFRRANLHTRIIEEALWGADYLHRLLDDEGYFYMTVFDRWARPGAERVVTAYIGIDGVYTQNYQAAFREGAGLAIAALARASTVSTKSGLRGEFPAAQYLRDAEKAFAHLQKHNREYCDDGVENIIDDYTALLAATELYRATRRDTYLEAARVRAENLNQRLTPHGWFRSDEGSRPFYHAAEAGFPIVSLTHYLRIERDETAAGRARETIRKALDHQLELNARVANPFDYARQTFRTYANGKLDETVHEGFFIPHANETGYWWQGENARLASLATAAILGGRLTAPAKQSAFGVDPRLGRFAQRQLDWILGRNPFDLCMLYGFGAKNPPDAESAGIQRKGGISNGITGAADSDEGRGITFAPGPDDENWRWIEQWLPHSSWFLIAVTTTAEPPRSPRIPSTASTVAAP